MSALRDEQEGVIPTPTREPEKLVIPADAVAWLIMKAFSSEAGDAWLRGFITAHGEPSWFVEKRWGLKPAAVEIVKANPPGPLGMNGTS